MAEAQNQGHLGMVAVGEVISRRSQDKGKTPLAVVTSRVDRVHAFSCLNRTSPAHLVARHEGSQAYAEALSIAAIVCRTPEQLPGITHGATHFTRSDENPRWARNQRPVAVIRDHSFYRLARY